MLRIGFVGTAVFVVAMPLWCQQPRRLVLADSSVKRILAPTTKYREISGILRQMPRPQSRRKLDEIADSLALRSIAHSSGEAQHQYGTDEVLAIVASGQRVDPRAHGPSGTPYDGSVERLVRIHRGAPASAFVTRAAALDGMNQVVGFDRAAAYLMSVATSVDQTANSAMRLLIMDATPKAPGTLTEAERDRTRLQLRNLWDRAASSTPSIVGPDGNPMNAVVKSGDAYGALWRFAKLQGWRK